MTESPPESPFEPWTPIECEREIARLINAVAQAETVMRTVLVAESDARKAYERAQVIHAHDPNCPRPDRSTGVTVGQRDSWIRDMALDEFDGLEYAKVNLTIQRNYQNRLEQQCSLVQTMSKLVQMSYSVMGSGQR